MCCREWLPRSRCTWADLLDGRAAGPADEPYTPVSFEQQVATFGLRVYQVRRLQRLSQPVLADRAGVSRPVISHIERGTENVTLKTLSGLAAGLGVGWSVLLDDRRPPPMPERPTTVVSSEQPTRPRARLRTSVWRPTRRDRLT